MSLNYHDGVGNRTQFSRTVSSVLTTRTYAYGATNNRLNSVNIGATADRTFTHDASGNITGDNRGTTAGNFTHTINRAGRIATTLKGGVNQGTYTYDAFERLRIRVVANQTPTTNNGTTHYVWDIFGQIIAEANGSTGVTLRETIYLDSMPLAAIHAVLGLAELPFALCGSDRVEADPGQLPRHRHQWRGLRELWLPHAGRDGFRLFRRVL
jgi:hypothetical protein